MEGIICPNVRTGWARHAVYEILENISAINPDVNLGRKLTCRVVRHICIPFNTLSNADVCPQLGLANRAIYLRLRSFTTARRGTPFVHWYNKKRENISVLKTKHQQRKDDSCPGFGNVFALR